MRRRERTDERLRAILMRQRSNYDQMDELERAMQRIEPRAGSRSAPFGRP